MRNPSTVGYEGVANLLDAFRVAADAGSRSKGVLVVLNGEINAARDVMKTDAQRLDTFQSPTAGLLGVVDSDRVVYYRRPVKRNTVNSEFDVASVATLPRVDVILVYQGAPGDLIKAAVDLGARGIVVASAGAGATSGTQNAALQAAARLRVFVVTTTRTGSGRIGSRRDDSPPATDEFRRYYIRGEDLQPVKARILLMLALARTDDPAEIQRMFTEY